MDLSASSNIAALGARQQCLVVRILQYNGNKWVDLGQRIKCNDNAAAADDENNFNDSFGTAVSLSKDGAVLAVGGEPGRIMPQGNVFQEQEDGALFRGRVRVYRLQGNKWQIILGLFAPHLGQRRSRWLGSVHGITVQ